MGGGGQCHVPAALPPRKTRYPLYRWLGVPHGQSGRVQKISHPTGIRSAEHPACSESLYRLSYPGPYGENSCVSIRNVVKMVGTVKEILNIQVLWDVILSCWVSHFPVLLRIVLPSSSGSSNLPLLDPSQIA